MNSKYSKCFFPTPPSIPREFLGGVGFLISLLPDILPKEQGNGLCYVLQPLYQKNGKKSQTAFEYRYDSRGRKVKKFLPGGGYIQYWYDNADRIIGMQDATMRAKGIYRFTFYDHLGRLAVQGQANCLSIPDGVNIVAKYTGNGGFRDTGYTLSCNPISNATAKSVKIEIVNYYDNYSFSKGRTASCFAGFSDTTKVSQIGNLTGCLTLCSNGEYISQIMGYDLKGNLVKSKSREIGGKTVTTTSKYSFTNKLLSSASTINVKYGNSLKINEKIGYNKFNDKKSSDTISVNHGTATSAILKYTYDYLGRLSSVSRPSSSVSYAYELHGWLTNITTNSFKEDLFYADCPDSTYNCYNGNIGTMRWSNSNYEQIRGYKFVYDNANRLTDALYGERAKLDNKVNRYNEVLEYDENGNITNLQRRGLKQDGQYGKIDNLNLSYIGNQLSSVEEDAKDYDYEGSFEYKKANGSQYMYNENGSLVADKSRKIAYIAYDLNNNPQQIYFTNGNVTKYIYSASGQKLRAIHYTAKPNITRTWGKMPNELTLAQILLVDSTDYLLGGSLVMKNGKIDKVLFDGGYAQATAVNKTTKDKFAFYYYNQDHLGNNREVVDASGAVTQVTNYYPFGAPYADATASKGSDVQPYKYNGKELDLMHGLNTYDYGARQHDPILCRWDRIDPLCEDYYETSPYIYCLNNPVKNIDPDGKAVETLWDAANVIYDVGSAIYNHIKGDHKTARNSWIDAGFDFAATIIPGLPAGATKVFKAADKTVDVTKGMKNAAKVEEGIAFEKDAFKASKQAGKDATEQVRLVPQNGKGNVKGNRTDADQLIKKSNGKFSIVETKLSSKTPLSKGQRAAQKHVNKGDGVFEVRSTKGGLKKGDKIKVEEYRRVNKYN